MSLLPPRIVFRGLPSPEPGPLTRHEVRIRPRETGVRSTATGCSRPEALAA